MWRESLPEFLLSIMDALVPPADSDPRAVEVHRWRVTVVACSAFCGLIVSIIISYGLVPGIFPGFATARDVNDLRQVLLDERSSILDQQIFQLRQLNCTSKSDSEREMVRGRIQDLMQRYYNVTGRSYDLPACGDF